MSRSEKIRLNLTGADLFYGKIELRPNRGFSCFFIVNHTDDEEFVKKTAMEFILTPCKDFHFFGKKEHIWHFAFDLTDSMIYPDSTYETVARTSGYKTVEEFSACLKEMISIRSCVPYDYYLIYDDRNMYDRVVEFIR